MIRVEQGYAAKRVLIRFRDAITRGEWRDLQLPLNEVLPDRAKLFKISGTEGRELEKLPQKIEFAVKAEFDGFDAYDDNRGQSYWLGSSDGPLLNIPLVLRTYGYYKDKIFGTIFLKNYAPHKRVLVFYSMDNCGSFSCVDAVFKRDISTGPKDLLFFPNVHNCDAWEFSIHVDKNTRSCCLYLEYECEGNKYYDLNYNRLYRINKTK